MRFILRAAVVGCTSVPLLRDVVIVFNTTGVFEAELARVCITIALEDSPFEMAPGSYCIQSALLAPFQTNVCRTARQARGATAS
jgi:hypothetical protein